MEGVVEGVVEGGVEGVVEGVVEGRGSRQTSVGEMGFQPRGYFSQNLAQIGLIRGSQTILRADVFVMGESNDIRVMGGVVISKDTFPVIEICVCVADAHGIAQLSADHFVEVEERFIPKEDTAPDDTVVIVRSQTNEGFLEMADQDILAQSALQRCEVVIDIHAATGAFDMN